MLAILGVIVAIFGIIISVTVPEVRQFLHLSSVDEPKVTVQVPTNSSTGWVLIPLSQMSTSGVHPNLSGNQTKPTDQRTTQPNEWTLVTLENGTNNWTIYYCLEDEDGENCDYSLKPRYSVTHWTSEQTVEVSFDAGTGANSINKTYQLDGWQYKGNKPELGSGKPYVFMVDSNNITNLYLKSQ